MESLVQKLKPILSENDLVNLNEHLISLDNASLLKQLQRIFSEKIRLVGMFSDRTERYAMRIVVPVGVINSQLKREKFLDFLDKAQWYITNEYPPKDKLKILDIEPIYSESVTDFVYKHKYIYHITSKQRTKNPYTSDTVTDKGLRPRKGTTYRYFPSRVYFICGDDIKRVCNEVMDDLDIKESDVRIFRIDVSKLPKGINFYQDSMYDIDNFFYAYIKMPWEIMDEITIDEL